MITLEKVKFIREKKSDNPDQLNLFGDNGDKKNKKNKAQQYTDKINKQNKNRPESKRGKRVFPGDKSGAYQAAKSDLEARQGIKKAGGSGDIGYTAPDRASKVAKRTTRADKLGTPDPFTTPSSKKPIRPFGLVGRDKAPEGLFGAGETKGQMTAKRMDAKSFKKTQPTSDLLPKSFKDFDKKIKSLKVDTDIERRISNPKTASIINKTKTTKRGYRTKGGGYEKLAKDIGVKLDPKSKTIPSQNPDLMARRALGAAGSDSNFSSAEPVPSRPFKPARTFVDKVRKNIATRKAKAKSKVDSKVTQPSLFDQPKKSDVKFSSGAKGKFASGSVDLGNTDAKFANRQRIKEPPKFDGQQNIFNDPKFDKPKSKSTSKPKTFKQLSLDIKTKGKLDGTVNTYTANRRSKLVTGGRGNTITIPKIIRQGKGKGKGGPLVLNKPPYNQNNQIPLSDTEVVTQGKFVANDKGGSGSGNTVSGNMSDDQFKKFMKDQKKTRKQQKKMFKKFMKQSKAAETTVNVGRKTRSAKDAMNLARKIRAKRTPTAGKILKGVAKAAIRNPLKAGLIGAGIAGAYYGGKALFNRRNDLTKDDIGTTSVIKNKSGKGIDFKYPTFSDTNKGKNKNKEDTGFKNPDGTYNPAIFRNKKGFLSGDSKAPRQTAFQNKFKTGEFKVDGAPKNKDGTAFTLNKNLAGSAFEKQLQQAEKGTGRGYNPFGKNFLKKYQTKKDRRFLNKYKDATRPTKTT